jgi:hypothetical protein
MQMVELIKNNRLLVVLFAVLAAAFLLLRSTPSDIGSVEELNRLLAGGHPTVLAFYSNF